MEYLDFEIAVEPRPDGDYLVTVVDSPAGEASATMRFPYDRLALENKMQSLQIALLRSGGKRRSAATSDDATIEQLGRDLFKTLFAGEISNRLDVSRLIASREGRGIRIKLRMESPELMSLPWEYLFDEDKGDYLSLGIATPVVRYVPLAQSIRPLEVGPPLRVLGMIAGPSDLGELDSQREKQRLELALSSLVQRKLVEFEWVPGETWVDLQEALWRGPWHVFHFIGHGGFSEANETGLIYLTGDDGKSRELSATDVGRLLGDHEPLRLALLNSCESAQSGLTDVFSSTAATLVRRGTPAVVAMQFEITDDAAIQFSRVFYAAIAYGMPVDGAVAEARKSVALQVANSYEWGTPVLFMRSRDGLLFKVPQLEGDALDPALVAPESASTETEGPAEPKAPDPIPPAATDTVSVSSSTDSEAGSAALGVAAALHELAARAPVSPAPASATPPAPVADTELRVPSEATIERRPEATPPSAPPATATVIGGPPAQPLSSLWGNNYSSVALGAMAGGLIGLLMASVIAGQVGLYGDSRLVAYLVGSWIGGSIGVFAVVRQRDPSVAVRVAGLNWLFSAPALVVAGLVFINSDFMLISLIAVLGLVSVGTIILVLSRRTGQ